MKLLDDHIKAAQAILDYFGFEGGGYPFDDLRGNRWFLDRDSAHWGEEDPEVYCEDIYHGGVYRKGDYTMVHLRPCTGDGTTLAIFDNALEVKDVPTE